MADPTGATPPLNTYAKDWGGILTSTFLASIIYGITILQSFYYYNTYPHDRFTWKVLVFAIMALDTAALGLVIYCMHYYLVLSWGIPEMLLPDVKRFPAEYVITSILVTLVQSFYINTIRALRAPLPVTILLIILSLTALGSGLILPVIQLNLKFIPVIVVYPLNHTAFNISRGTALACDLGIVAALCWLLGKRKTEVRRANNMINALIAFSVERGVLQAIVQAGEVMAYAIKPDGIYFLPFHVIVSRIYCTSLLATLNTREYVAKRGIPTVERHTRITFAANAKLDATATDSGPIMSSYFDPPFLFANPNVSDSRDEEERVTSTGRMSKRGALRLDLGSQAGVGNGGGSMETRLSEMPELTSTASQAQLQSRKGKETGLSRSVMSSGSEWSLAEGGKEDRYELKDMSRVL